MADSVFKQIAERVRTNLEPLGGGAGPFRKIKRTHNLTLLEAIKPALHYKFGDEVQIGKDIQGRLYERPLLFKLIFDKPELEEDLVAEVIRVIEADVMLNRLCVTVDNRTLVPFVNAVTEEVGGVLLTWDITYRHRLGQPETQY